VNTLPTPLRETPALKTSRLVLAFCVTPFLPGFYGALLFAQPWALPIGLAVAYPSALAIGVPLIMIMRRRAWLSWWCFVIAGALCALPALIAYAYVGDVPHLDSFNLPGAALVVASGAFTGACFWLLGVAGESPVRVRDLFNVGPPG
jgi:hypothetical protein